MKFFKNFSWSLFILVVACAFLPFANISCSGNKAGTLTGASLALGTKMYFGGHEQSVPIEPRLTAVYVICLVSGILLLIKKTRKAFTFALMTTLISFALLTWCKFITDQMIKQNPGNWSISYDTGCYATMILLSACMIFTFIFAIWNKDEKRKEQDIQNTKIVEQDT